ncbi:putative mitochondrial protein, partial [Mucuna pruriens]
MDDRQQFPIIIANNLNREQEEKLLNVLRKHKKAIGYMQIHIAPMDQHKMTFTCPFGHLISSRGIEFDKAKVDIIASLPKPASVWEVRSFLGHAGFCRHLIKNFSKIALPLSKLLQKDVDFAFNQPCMDAFEELEKRLMSTPILQALNWQYPF